MSSTTSWSIAENAAPVTYSLYPNPANDRLFIRLQDSDTHVYYVTITNALGKTVMMLPQPQLQNGIDISGLAPGAYFVQLMDEATKTVSTQKFIRQ